MVRDAPTHTHTACLVGAGCTYTARCVVQMHGHGYCACTHARTSRIVNMQSRVHGALKKPPYTTTTTILYLPPYCACTHATTCGLGVHTDSLVCGPSSHEQNISTALTLFIDGLETRTAPPSPAPPPGHHSSRPTPLLQPIWEAGLPDHGRGRAHATGSSFVSLCHTSCVPIPSGVAYGTAYHTEVIMIHHVEIAEIQARESSTACSLDDSARQKSTRSRWVGLLMMANPPADYWE